MPSADQLKGQIRAMNWRGVAGGPGALDWTLSARPGGNRGQASALILGRVVDLDQVVFVIPGQGITNRMALCCWASAGAQE